MASRKHGASPIEVSSGVVPRPEHLVGQGVVASVQHGEKRSQLFRISLGPDDKVCVFGKHSSWTEEWTFRRYRRGADGAWVRDNRPGLHLDPAKGELFRDGLLQALHQRGVPAPSLGFTYLAERHEAEAAEGEPGALVSHLVLKALGRALGQGDQEGLGELGRAALKYIRTQTPGYVAFGDGDGLLDRKGDDSRNTGKDQLLHCATSFCREVGLNADVGRAALDLAWEVERLHPDSYLAAVKLEAEAHPEQAATPAVTRLCDRLARRLERSVRPTPESVARLALKTLGAPKEKVAHYFDYRYAGVDRSKTVTKYLPGRSGRVQAYVAVPARDGLPRTAVVVIPELFAVTDHAEHVARRLAREGFLAIVPHLLHRSLGSTDPTEVPSRLAKAAQALSAEEIEQDLRTLLDYLELKRQIRAPSVGLLGFEAGAATA